MIRKLLFAATAMLTFLLAEGQSYTSRWQYSYGGDLTDQLTTMIPRPGSLFFYAGTSESRTSCTRSSDFFGDQDFVAMIFNNAGTKLWERAYGGDKNDLLFDAVAVPAGGYVLVGGTFSGKTGNKTSALVGGEDLWVVRIDDLGNVLWDRTYGRSEFEEGHRVVVTTDGGFLIGGTSYTPLSGYNNGQSDYQLWKLDANGDLVWTKLYGGSRYDELIDLEPTSDGNYFLSGTSDSPPDGTKTHFQLGGVDTWIVKIAPDGTQIWDKTFGYSTDDTGGRLTTLLDGNMLMVENSPGMGRLRKIDVNGNEIWLTTCINPTRKDVFEVAAEDPLTGNLYVGGTSNSGLDGCKNSDFIGGGVSDVWITTYDPLGHKMEDMDFGGSSMEAVNDIYYLNGEIWVTGTSSSPVSGNKKTANCSTSIDGWILRLFRKFYITAPKSICNTSSAGKLQFTTVADFLPGNRFTIQLSDPNGDFSHPIELGHLDAVRTDSISFVLPPGVPAGTGYKLRLYSTLPTDTSGEFPFTIHGTPAGLLGRDTALCVGATMVLAPQEQPLETTYLWQDNSTAPKLQVDHVGLFWVEATNACGVSRDSITLVAGDLAVPQLGPDREFCEGAEFAIQDAVRKPGATYLWNTGDTSLTLQASTAGAYWVEATNACGHWRDSIQMTMLPKPPVKLEAFAVICKGSATRLDAGEGQAAYRWSTGDTTATMYATITGVYQVTVTDTRGCTATGETEIFRVVDPPAFFLGADTSICENGSIRLKAGDMFESYRWNDGSAAPFFSAERPGLYWLQVTDRDGCQGRDSIVVSLRDCATGLYVPSAFTPNGDGLNDRFHAMLHGRATEYECSVFDRFGELVFRTQDPAGSWDGTVKGIPAPVGTFTWVCRFALVGGTRQVQKGTFVLIR